MGLNCKQVSSIMHKTLLQSQTPADQLKSSPSVSRRQQQQQLEQLNCPRCDSTNTKFCYYNNYNKLQPRHYCRACKRHWTKGGNLRNVPVGGVRKNKHHKKSSTAAVTAATTAVTNTHLTIQTQNHDLDQKSLCDIFYHQGLMNPPTVNNGIFLGSTTTSATFPQNYLNSINPMSISTSLDMNSSPLFSTSYFPASDHDHVHNYFDHHDIDHHQEASITSSISNDQWKIPAAATNCWNWDEIDTFNIVSTDYDLNQISSTTTWDHDSDDIIKP